MIEHNHWARRLYVDTIQHYDPRRHRPYAPAMYFPADVGDDYLIELTQEHEVTKGRKLFWDKVSQSAVNDFGDCEKYGLVMDFNLGCRHRKRDDGGARASNPSRPASQPGAVTQVA